ncbi:MAG: oligosaccharide flippase family protein [Acidobacteriota bacterium]
MNRKKSAIRSRLEPALQSAIKGDAATIYDKIKNTVKHTIIYSIGSFVSSAFGVLLIPLYTRKLRASEYGVLALMMVTLTLVSVVLKFGLNQAFFRHYYDTEDPEHRHRIVGSTFIFLLCSTILFTAVLYWLAPHIAMRAFTGESQRPDLLRLIFLIGFFEVINIIPDSILRAKFYSARYSGLNITAFIVQIALICYLVYFVEASVKMVLIGRLIGVAFETAIFYVAVWRDLSLKFSFQEVRDLLAFGSPFIFSAIASTLFIMIDRFFLERYSGETEVGVYSLANNVTGAVTALAIMPFSQVWTVMRFKVMNEEGADEYYSRVLTYIVFVSMFLALGVAALAGNGLLLFAHRSYYLFPTILPLLALSVVLDSASRVLNVGITLRKRTLYGPLLTIAALLFNIALNFWLIPRYGSIGASISTLLSYAFFCIIRYTVSNLFFPVHYEWRRVFMILGIGSIIIASFYAIDFTIASSPRKTLLVLTGLIKACIALMFPFALLALRFYDQRELNRISEKWQQLVALIKNGKREAVLLRDSRS